METTDVNCAISEAAGIQSRNKSNQKKSDIDAVILDLSRIERVLVTSSTDKDRFLENFERWMLQREKTIAELGKLKTELDDVYLKSKAVKCLGVGASIAGGLAAVVGFGLSLSSDETTSSTGKKLAEFGSGIGIAGGTTSTATSLVEHTVNQRILNDVKSALEEDQRMTKELIPYFQSSEDLNSLFKEVFDCDILSDTVDDFFTVVKKITYLCNEGKHAYKEISDAFSFSVEECLETPDLENMKLMFRKFGRKVQFVLKEFCKNPKVREAVLKIIEAIKRSPIVIDISKFSLKLMLGVSGITKDLNSYFSFPNIKVKVTHFLMKCVEFAMAIIALISNVTDTVIFESDHTEKVKKIQSFLIIELKEVKRSISEFKRY